MNICVFTHNFPRFEYDTQVPFIESLARGYVNKGHKVFVLAPWTRGIKERNKDYLLKVSYFKYIYPKFFHLLGYSNTLERGSKLKWFVYPLFPFYFIFASINLFRSIKCERIDVVNAHFLIPNGLIAVIVGKILKKPVFISSHGTDIYLGIKNRYIKKISLFVSRHSRAIIVPSPDFTKQLTLISKDIEGKIKMIPHGVDPQIFKPSQRGTSIKKQIGLEEKDLVLLAVGRLIEEKGFIYLLQSMPEVIREIPNTKLLIIGDGLIRKGLEGETRKLNLLNNIIFLGEVRRDVLPNYFSVADLMVVPSVKLKGGKSDGLPTVVLEGMASGLPIIATRIGGIPLVLKDNVNGCLIKEKDSDELAGKIIYLLSDNTLRQRLGLNNRKKVEKELTWDKVARQYLNIFKNQ